MIPFFTKWCGFALYKHLCSSSGSKPVNCFLQDDASAGIQSLQTSIEIKLCQNPGDRLYTALILDEASSTELSYRQTWRITFGPINWESTFKNIQKNNFDRKANDLHWKILHRCIPTAKRLAGRSPYFLSSTCQVCKKYEENLTHLFFLCPSAKKIWKYITALIRQRFPTYANYSVTLKDILCDFPDFDELRNVSVAGFLRDVGLRHICQHRNSVVYDDKQLETLCIFKAKVKQKVQTEFQIAKISGKLEKFQRDWTLDNLLTEIRNGVLVLNF